MIQIEHVTKKYGSGAVAIDDLSLTVPQGSLFGFLGPNGAGKTTLIKMMTGILNPTNGCICVDGADIVKNPIEAKRRIGYVPDDTNLYRKLKGLEYLQLMADLYRVKRDCFRARVPDLAERFGMQNVLADTMQSYSQGMRKKMMIMGALIHDPKVWILDEPMTGLDPKSSFMLKSTMHDRVKQGCTIFFSTHVLDVVERLCNRMAVVHQGRLIFDGTLENMKKEKTEDATLESLFLEMTADA